MPRRFIVHVDIDAFFANDFNDIASSMQIEGGCCATLYQDNGFSGELLRTNEPEIAWFDELCDEVSSITIASGFCPPPEPESPPEPECTVSITYS